MPPAPPIFPMDSPGDPHPVHQPSGMDGVTPPVDDPAAPPPVEGSTIPREKPEPDEKRRKLVADWASKVKSGKRKWEKTFKKMVKDQKFCAGSQWPEETKIAAFNDDFNDLYVANITLRHVKQRVAAVYAKNPKVIAKIRPRILSTVWDGTIQGLTQAQQTLQMQQAAMDARQKLGMGLGLGLAAAKAGLGGALGAGGPPTTPGGGSSGVPGGAGRYRPWRASRSFHGLRRLLERRLEPLERLTRPPV